jgi:hypothetical protein
MTLLLSLLALELHGLKLVRINLPILKQLIFKAKIAKTAIVQATNNR